MAAVFMYQRNIRSFIRYKSPTKQLSLRAEKFVESVQQKRLNSLYTIAWYNIILLLSFLIYQNNLFT